MNSLAGKKGLIIGIANEHSIAWGCAKAFHEAGAELAITYLNEKAEPYVRPLAEKVKAPIIVPLDVTDEEQLEALFEIIGNTWGKLDFLLHSIAYAPKEDLQGRVTDCSRQGFLTAMDISCYSFTFSDYSVCTTWGITSDHKIVLLDVFREKLEFPELKKRFEELAEEFNPTYIAVEDKMSGTALYQELWNEGIMNIHPIVPKADKEIRIAVHAPKFEQGRVYLPKQAKWLDAYVYELTTFPGAKYDDQVDSTSHGLDLIDKIVPLMRKGIPIQPHVLSKYPKK